MKKTPSVALLSLSLVALAGCGPGRAAYPAGSVNPLALEPPPIYSLFGYRAELELTSAQVEALDSIAREVKRRNDPITDSLRAIADERGGRARGIIPISDETRPMLERVRDNNRAATLDVQEVLSDEQEETVCRIVDQTRRGRERSRGDREREPGAVARADSALFMVSPVGWPWCVPAAGDRR
jgi:hypothetical protein